MSYYSEKLEEGLNFQDYMTDVFYERGIVLVTYVSKLRSDKSENKFGIEIKRDGKFRETGNLFIEVSEKGNAGQKEFHPSGIYRDDNSWLYSIGDEKTIWIFSKNILRLLASRYTKLTIRMGTSQGFKLPISDADKYCAKKIDVVESLDGGPAPGRVISSSKGSFFVGERA